MTGFAPGYHQQAPPASLADWIECLWWRRSDGPEARDRILPDGRIDLVWSRAGGVLVAGPQTRSFALPFAPPFLAVGVRFHPGAAPGLPAAELLDAHTPLDAVDPRLAAVLTGRLEAAAGPTEAFAAFTAVLAGRERPDPLVRAAVGALARGAARVADVAAAAAISERQLQRRFRTAVGYGPKTLQRVLRFQRVVGALAREPGDLAGHAARAGYADQAHLTREVRELSGLTPVELGRWLAA